MSIPLEDSRNYGPLHYSNRRDSARPPFENGPQRIASRTAAADYVRSVSADLDGSVMAMFLDGNLNLLALDCVGQGNAANCSLKPYLLVRRGLELGAVGFILIQHSPERVLKATAEEVRLTREIRRAGEDFDVHLLDHLIITRNGLIDVP